MNFYRKELQIVAYINPHAAVCHTVPDIDVARVLIEQEFLKLAFEIKKEIIESPLIPPVERIIWEQFVGKRSVDTLASELLLFALSFKILGESWKESLPMPIAIRATSHLLNKNHIELIKIICRKDIRLLGPLFEKMIGRNERYVQGQYFTPTPIALHMADFLQGEEYQTILDPAVGAGVLLAASAAPDRTLIGYDINPLCSMLTAAGLSLAGHNNYKIETRDFLAEHDLFNTNKNSINEVDAVICNPPYIRHHLIDKNRKKRLVNRYSRRFKTKISALSTNYIYFFLEAISQLRHDGALIFITPTDYLDAKYGEALKKILVNQFHIERIELFDRNDLAFKGVLTTSAITILRKRESKHARHVLIEARSDDGVIKKISTRKIDLHKLNISDNWSLQFGNKYKQYSTLIKNRSQKLSDFIRVRRGIATGSNKFFVLSQMTVDKWAIEPEFLKPVIASARDLPDNELSLEHWNKLRISGRPCWILDCIKPESSLKGLNIHRYLQYGRSQNVHERFNCRVRKPWYKIEQVSPPDIIITYMNRKKTKFVKNSAGCRVMSVFLNGFIQDNKVEIKWLLSILNNTETNQLIGYIGRTYGGGMKKIEPRRLQQLPMPRMLV